MEILSNLIDGFGYLAGWMPIMVILAGVIFGIMAGVMPGLSPSIGVALLVPFTYGMDPLLALILLAAVYSASNYGGSITAIAINTPGTPGAVATSFDGYPLTKQGKPGLALGISIISSTAGGIIGTIILILFSVPLAKFTLKFGPPEYFSLALLGLTIVSSLSSENYLKGFIATAIGLLLTTFGMDPFTGYLRFTFGVAELADGFTFIPALIGLFALGEVFINLEKFDPVKKAVQKLSGKLPTLKEVWSLKRIIAQSSLLGTLIGTVPGAGSAIATFIAYNEAKRTSKHPEKFGHGALEGVAAPESANNASVGGALVPLLALGIPGSASTAVLIGALLLHGLVPGPELFIKHADIVYGLFASLLLANVFMLVLGIFGRHLWVKIISASKAILYPIIMALSFIGSYSVNNSLFDVGTCLGFGVLGWILKRYKYPTAPVVLGLILGFMVEANFRRTMIMGDASIFFTRPFSLIMLTLAIASFGYPIIKQQLAKMKGNNK